MYFGGRRQAVDDVAGSARGRSGGMALSRTGLRTLAAALSVLVVAGCGSSTSSTSSTANSTADSGFLAQANGACRTAYAKVNALRAAAHGNETTKEIASRSPKVAVIAQSMLGQLTALTPPASLQNEYTKMLAAWRQEISQNLVRSQAAIAGNTKQVGEADAQIETLAKEFDTAASSIGLNICAGNA